MLRLKQNSQTNEDEEYSLQEIFRRLHSMQAIEMMRWGEYTNIPLRQFQFFEPNGRQI